ncbi:MAG TPA: hypothetical protein VK582_22105 [Pyrinomonadaceae bacterium]|nr:hypothetical protein [Pyrinomonadaceae bacterium]
MTTPIQLASGLGGAIGSDYVQSKNQLYFVEFNGKVSVLDLVRPLVGIVSQGTIVIKGTWLFDCESGTLPPLGTTTGDIWWEQIDTVRRQMVPQNSAKIINLGPVDFDALTHVELQNLPYGTTPIPGNNDASNKLVNGDVFAVQTNAGNYAKIKVLNYDYNMKVQWVNYRVAPRYRVLGTGYTQPEDIKVTSGGRYAYVTERSGDFLRVDLTNANRAAATFVVSGLTAPHQIALDENHGQAYVPEFTGTATGKIWRIDLSSGAKTAVYTGLQGCTGLLLSNDLRYAYVAEQVSGANRVARINLATAQRDVLVAGLEGPFFMEWADESESRIILPERDPANRVIMLDLTATPVTVTKVLTGVASRPSSIVLTNPGTMIVCSDSEINQYDLSSSLFSLAGPVFMGIGLVPVDHIINTGNNNTDGYADTTDNPGYILQVKDAPFGGTLAIMINHNAAFLAGATYYKLFVSQVTPVASPPTEPRQSFSDYLWNAASSSFIPRATGPDASGFYPVRLPFQIWYNPLLGYMLDTSILPNGLCVIDIKLYNAAKVEIPVGSIHSRRVKIDNQWPVANIEKIFHDGVEVPVCQIVNSGTDQFTFRITASDPQGHLLSWNLSAVWGDNQSGNVGGDSYSSHVSPTRQWAGVVSGDVPTPAWHATVGGDSTSTRCAHTFYLGVWDRVINGYGYLHYQTYHKSITIWL